MAIKASIFETPLVFVDVETNGLNHIRGRVIEVAAIRVEAGIVTGTFNSLIDPESAIPLYITNLTGITTLDVCSAPTFDQIADELLALMTGAVFVAHNVRFDYSFLKQEFGRIGLSFLPKQLCTVRLSRSLFPHERGHKLEDIIRRYNFTFTTRHRAYDDANVLRQFLSYLPKHFPPEQIDNAVQLQLKQPAFPKALAPEIVSKLPDGAGVYIFEDEKGTPLYIGKSVHIKKRVLSHFGSDHKDGKEFKISQTVHSITAKTTAGELSALLLESRLIKQYQPLYNRRLRRTTKLVIVRQIVNEHKYLQVETATVSSIDPDETGAILAVYPNRSKARDALQTIISSYKLCPKLMNLEKSNGACFLYQLKKCNGACIQKETPADYNSRVVLAFERQRIQEWPYAGPIAIEETASPTTSTQSLIVDQWCLLGEVNQDPYCSPVVSTYGRAFDLDTYKILQSYLAAKISKLRIRPISPNDMQLFYDNSPLAL